MASVINDETVKYVSILAKLELPKEEKESTRKDMDRTLDYFDKLNELDATRVEPMSHVFPVYNVFREDMVTSGGERDDMLRNASKSKKGMFRVPKTIE